MNSSHALLWSALRSPHSTCSLDEHEWERLLRLAKIARVWPQLASRLADAALVEQLPAPVRPYLEAALEVAQYDERVTRWELRQLAKVLSRGDYPLVLLKGAAYLAAGLPIARGRRCSDVDLLVPRRDLDRVEQMLLTNGWQTAELSRRDEQYYRAWLQELPPLEHSVRKTVLDLHHTILPAIQRLQVDAAELIRVARPIVGSRFHVLAPADMLMHSAVHLFRNGDFRHGIRDLYDIDGLARHFSAEQGFWDQFVARVQQFRVESPCYFAITHARRLFETPIPAEVAKAVDRWAPRWPQPFLMDWLIRRALLPEDLDDPRRSQDMAIWLLSHWPLHRLAVLASPLFWSKRLRR